MAAVDTSRREALRKELTAEFEARTPASAALAARARRVMPGGDTRAVAFHAPYPLAAASGHGHTVVDLDGNEYTDVLYNYTSLLHGHANPAIEAAVVEQLPKGTNYAMALESQVRLADHLVERVASVEQVRFTNSGTEAVMFAVRAARAFTGRELIVKIEGGYHGAGEDFEISVHPDLAVAGPDGEPVATLDTLGIPRNRLETVAVVPFNDAEAAERLFARRGGEIAAIVIEPCMGSAGMIPPAPGYLQALRDLTARHGALLIADEVMSFRLGYGGMQEVVGVEADLTAFAKIIGGGFPVGAFGGREEVMRLFDPRRPGAEWHSGTFAGNAITMTAGAVAMELYPRGEVERLNRLGDRLRDGIAAACRWAEIPAVTTGYGGFVGLHFGEAAVVDGYRAGARMDVDLKRLVHLALLLEGVFAAPRLMLCLATPMDEAVVDDVIARFRRALARVV